MIFDNPDSILAQWYRNRIFFSGFWSWFIAQSLKVFLGVLQEHRFNFRWFVGSGGMPSSHAALASGLTTSVGMIHGFDSGLFAMAFAFAVITMFDAQGVRRQSGKQAEALNRILDDLAAQKGIQEQRLKELFGHTPVEVFAGAFIGILIAVIIVTI
ncbi:MAG TPA: divergent PAP2 family protein [Candidatus Omnitrophota bacterium]|nr:divergent PAP2 family protein [Candidatus Omnitrophota bacterium]